MENTKHKVLAVVGMCGTGKSVVTEILSQNGWSLVYFGGVVLDTVKKRNLEITPENEKKVRESLREEHGMAAMAIELWPTIEAKQKEGPVVLDGLYSWAEYTYLKDKLGDSLLLLAVVSDAGQRYQRLTNRKIRPLTQEEAIKRDISEIENMEKGGPIAIADYYIYNNASEKDLKEKVFTFLDQIS